jgi:hypothetical protein
VVAMAEAPSMIRGQTLDEITVDLDNTVYVTHATVNLPTNLLCLGYKDADHLDSSFLLSIAQPLIPAF